MHFHTRWPALTALAATVLLPTAALACGGLFCSVVPPAVPEAPAPVDQTAERIVFEVGEGTVTAHVQISYVGPADGFAWIVPVPETPEVAESDPDMFQEVDGATSLDVILPPPEVCPQPSFGDDGARGCAVGCGSADSATMADGEYSPDVVDPRSPVTVYASDVTDNYEYSVIGAAEASDLATWLRDNGYNVSENMVPVMQPYIDEGMRYLAVKLREGRSATDIQPLSMTYVDDEPMIPIRLTAVAAQPLMGIQVWIFADAPYLPVNYAWMRPDETEILSDELGNTSYFAWVARATTESLGLLWSAEFIGENQTGRFPQHDVVSRFYTRMSPEQMAVDPVFARAPEAPVVTSVLDLSAQPTPFRCGGIDFSVLPSPCAWHYCGEGASCAVADGRVGCACPEGEVAMAIRSPDGAPSVTCVPAENPYGITPQAGGVGTEFDPCADVDCGAGECIVRNGFVACACDDGGVACIEPDATVVCVHAPDAQTFGPGAGSESAGVSTGSTSASTSRGSGFAFGMFVPPVLVLSFIAGLRRRRQDRSPCPGSASTTG